MASIPIMERDSLVKPEVTRQPDHEKETRFCPAVFLFTEIGIRPNMSAWMVERLLVIEYKHRPIMDGVSSTPAVSPTFMTR